MTINNAWDCYDYYVEKIHEHTIFIKEYDNNYISKHILELYHTLQKSLSSYKKEIYLGECSLEGKKIDKREIIILDLSPEEIYEASTLNKKTILITYPKYIPGKTLKEYENEIGKTRIQILCDNITQDLQRKSGILFTDMYGITPNNIKVQIKENIAILIITDISCNIKHLYQTGKNALLLEQLLHQQKKESQK